MHAEVDREFDPACVRAYEAFRDRWAGLKGWAGVNDIIDLNNNPWLLQVKSIVMGIKDTHSYNTLIKSINNSWLNLGNPK